jgi:hypothetical protein
MNHLKSTESAPPFSSCKSKDTIMIRGPSKSSLKGRCASFPHIASRVDRKTLSGCDWSHFSSRRRLEEATRNPPCTPLPTHQKHQGTAKLSSVVESSTLIEDGLAKIWGHHADVKVSILELLERQKRSDTFSSDTASACTDHPYVIVCPIFIVLIISMS